MLNKIIDEDIKNIRKDTILFNELRGKKILITGVTGFVGYYILNTLIQDIVANNCSTKIIVVVRNKEKLHQLFKHYLNYLEIINQDIIEQINYDKDVDYIIHCASNAAPKEYYVDPIGTIITNVIGTEQLLKFAKHKNVKKFLYLSTIEVYGQGTSNDKIKENDFGFIDSTIARSCYPLSKKTSENLCISYAEQYGVDVSIGRLSYLFGPGMKKDDSKIVAVLARSIVDNKNLILKSSGEQMRSYCYISDAVKGLLTILVKGHTKEAYNISSSKCITSIKGIAETLLSLYEYKKLLLIYSIPTEEDLRQFSTIKNSILSTEKLEKLGWTTDIDLNTGLKRMVDSLMEMDNG